MQITFSLDKTKVTKAIQGMANKVKDYSKPFEKVGNDLLHFYGVEVFEQQGVAGEEWRGLAHETVQARLKRWGHYSEPSNEGPERRILIWTGRLQKGFKKDVNASSLRIYNDVPYFQYHQRASGRPPQRRMLALTKDTIIQVKGAIVQYLRENPA